MTGGYVKTGKYERETGSVQSRYMNDASVRESTGTFEPAGAPEIHESVSYGEDQGGLRDAFRRRFGKKKTPEEENEERLSGFASSLSDSEIANLSISGPSMQQAVRHKGTETAGGNVRLDVDKTLDVSGMGDVRRDEELRYQEFLNSADAPRALAQDPTIRARALGGFLTQARANMAQGSASGDASMTLSAAFRGNGPEMKGFSQLLRASIPERTMNGLYQFGQLGMDGVDAGKLAEALSYKKRMGLREADMMSNPDFKQANDVREGAYGIIQAMVNDENSETGALLDEARGVFDGSIVTDEDQISGQLMNLLMNRAITPDLSTMARSRQASAQAAGLEDPKNQAAFDAAKRTEMYSNALLAGANLHPTRGLATNEHQGFMTSLKKRFARKRS